MNKWTIILFLLVLIVAFILGYWIKSATTNPERIYTVDTLLTERVRTEIKKDTVLKFLERVIYKNVTPEKEIIQTADTVFITQKKYFDLMLKVEKNNRDLKIFAFNENDSLLKEYTYKNIGNDFTATSQTGNVFVKSKKFDWNGIGLVGISDIKRTNEKVEYFKDFNFGLKTGVNYNRLNLDVYWLYGKDFEFRTELSYKLVE